MTDRASTPTFPDLALPTLRLRSPADLVEVVPYLVGFHPESSIVVLCLSRQDRQRTLTMRQDLPPGHLAGEAARSLAARVNQSGGELVLAACYPQGADERAAAGQLVTALAEELHRLHLSLEEAVRVEDGRWWSYLCCDPRCCSPEGTVVAAGPGVIGAAAVLSGHVALPSRAALADRLRPVDEITRRAVAQALADGSTGDEVGWGGFTTGLLRRYELRRGQLSPADAARLLDGLRDVRLRDQCAEWWYEPRRNGASVGLWTDAVRHAPPGYVAPAATLLAVSAWLDGEGAFANIALDRALADDPAYRLALLADTIIQGGVSPSQFREMRRDREVGLRRPGRRSGGGGRSGQNGRSGRTGRGGRSRRRRPSSR